MKPSLLVEGRSDLPFLGFEIEYMTGWGCPCSVFPCDPLIFLTGANDKDLPPVRCNGEVFRPTTSIIQCVSSWKENGARLSNLTHFCFPFEICWPKAPICARFGTYFAFYCLQLWMDFSRVTLTSKGNIHKLCLHIFSGFLQFARSI